MYYIYRQQHQFSTASTGEAGLLSAIIPVYDKKLSTLPTALQCVMQQRYDRLEILVVGNGVSDATLKRAIGQLPQRIRTVCLDKNMGASFARNVGALHARGEFLWFVDSDVLAIDPAAAQTALRLLRAHDSIAAIGGIIFQGSEGSYFSIGRIREQFHGTYAHADRLHDDDFVNTACLFVRRSAFNRVNGFTDFIEYPFDDVEFGYKLRAVGFRCVGSFPCAGAHPFHASTTTLFQEFMTLHNLLVHLLINYNLRSFASLLRKKRQSGWTMSPPRQPLPMRRRIRTAFGRLIALVLALGHLIRHAALLARLRRSQQQLLRGSNPQGGDLCLASPKVATHGCP